MNYITSLLLINVARGFMIFMFTKTEAIYSLRKHPEYYQ